MKKNLHSTVRQVVFKDTSSDFSFLGRSTMDSKETIKWEDGKSYPLIKVEDIISLASILHWKTACFRYGRSHQSFQEKIQKEVNCRGLISRLDLP